MNSDSPAVSETTAPERLPETEASAVSATSCEPQSCPITSKENCPYLISSILAVLILLFIVRLICRRKSGKCVCKKNAGENSNLVEIYVGNLSYDMTDAQLHAEFRKYGVIASARVITHHTSGKSKGFGFVEMPHRSEAEIAIKKLNNAEIMGRRLHVNEARANTRPGDRPFHHHKNKRNK